jgi:hypothetical protein
MGINNQMIEFGFMLTFNNLGYFLEIILNLIFIYINMNIYSIMLSKLQSKFLENNLSKLKIKIINLKGLINDNHNDYKTFLVK